MGDFNNLFAQLQVGGGFIGNTNQNIRYEVPEPITIFGSFAALGIGAALKRKHSRKIQEANTER